MEKPWYSFLYIKSPITKIVWGIVSTIVAIIVIFFVFFVEEDRMEAQTGNWTGRSIEKGAEIYANNCYTCHGDQGQGGAGPALNSKHFFTERLTDIGFSGTLEDYIELTVAAGRPSIAHGQFSVIMPTWSNRYGGPLRDDQVQQVTDYVLNWEATALLQTPEEDPFIPFVNVAVVEPQALQNITGTSTISGTGTISGTEIVSGTTSAQTGPRSPEVLFGPLPDGLGCVACHNPTLPEDASTRGLIGPNLGNLWDHAGTRVPGEDGPTYVHQSIVTPGAFVVPTYPPGVMPQGFETRMTPEELDALVAWLLDPSRVTQ